MRNFVYPGDRMQITAGSAIASGQGVLVGSIFGVAEGDIASGASGVIVLTGVYDLPKAGAQAWSAGDKVYWDVGAGQCTTSDGAGANTLIGVAWQAAGSADTTGRVRLNGAAV
ncbi:Predicted phage recombinase, RecA/RadA family [Meinhardsimonia xiamenensis]|jgi:predicted RecA/RadA family phage recombinase|uniref:Predicted phage recombinase, RecA/RadA family n=1 Tax=Meinhardsimonia xiamenensis TaxID=990712 RepID=A0A1G9DZQ9_9RHOB|nr:capsid cement protein [Meinhardsimonia xiamenensis]PRX29010.1 putative RecA/RadA family phage recombinase [Meinhardsimonia xiamenensis]SDK69354.1 Predicted phage recombinase, RecA/RadA family [Meinhardsimonia xiamenensis]